MYSIDSLCPSGGMGGYGFCIHLSHAFKEAVAKSGIDQEKANRVIKSFGREWLTHTGMSNHFDIENCTHNWKDNRRIPSEDFKDRDYRSIRLSWGKWGPEHISVPGNACGLDIDDGGFGCVFNGGKMLLPHNIDHWGQVNLLLIVFCWFAHSITLLAEDR